MKTKKLEDLNEIERTRMTNGEYYSKIINIKKNLNKIRRQVNSYKDDVINIETLNKIKDRLESAKISTYKYNCYLSSYCHFDILKAKYEIEVYECNMLIDEIKMVIEKIPVYKPMLSGDTNKDSQMEDILKIIMNDFGLDLEYFKQIGHENFYKKMFKQD